MWDAAEPIYDALPSRLDGQAANALAVGMKVEQQERSPGAATAALVTALVASKQHLAQVPVAIKPSQQKTVFRG